MQRMHAAGRGDARMWSDRRDPAAGINKNGAVLEGRRR